MKGTAALRRQILARSARIAVLGQGYVGLSLACAAAEAGFPVAGVDVDQRRAAALRAGETVPGVAPEVVRSAVATGRLAFTTDAGAVADARLVFICVPDAAARRRRPTSRSSTARPRASAAHLRRARWWSSSPRPTRAPPTSVVRPLLERSGLVAGKDFLLAYSPERIDPGNTEFVVPRTSLAWSAGSTPEATGLAALFYEQLVDKVVPVVVDAAPPSSRSCSRTRSAT